MNLLLYNRIYVFRTWSATSGLVIVLQPTVFHLVKHGFSYPYTEPSWGPEAKLAIQSLEKKLEKEPYFDQVLKDTTLPSGATARLACHIQGKVICLFDQTFHA